MSTPECGSGCRLAVKRFALGPAGRRFGDGGAEHPLGGSEVGQGPDGRGNGDRAVLLQGAVFGGVVGGAVLPAAPDDRGTRRDRGCVARGGARGRGRGRRRSGLAPRGASGGCCRRGCRTRRAAACCSPSGSWLSCVCRTRPRRRLGRRRRRACHGSGSARGSRRSRPAARRRSRRCAGRGTATGRSRRPGARAARWRSAR